MTNPRKISEGRTKVKLRVNKGHLRMFPNNCPLIERTGDGREVGTCTFYAPNGICPRHGDWRKLALDEEKRVDEEV